VADELSVTGCASSCTIRVTPTTTDYIKITAEYDDETAETTSIPKNRWVSRSHLREYSTTISNQLGVSSDTAHKAINNARDKALLVWNWRSFIQTGAATAPSFDHLRSLTVPDVQTGAYPTTEEIRDILEEKVEAAMRRCLYLTFDSPTSSGKSYKMGSTAWLDKPSVTGGRQVVHLSPTKPARTDAVRYSKRAGLDYYVIKGRTEACDLASGDHDPDGKSQTITVDDEPVSEWIARMCDYKNLSLHDAKMILLEEADQELDYIPCGGEDGKCETKTQWEDIFDSIRGEPEYDVIHATHDFAFVPTLVYQNNIAFDEQPTFAEIGPGDLTGGATDEDGMTSGRVKKAVNALLDDADVDIENADELMSIAKREAADVDYSELHDQFPEVYKSFRHRPDKEWYYNHPDAHTSASAFAELLWDAARQSPDCNGRRHSQLIYKPPTLTKTSNDEEIVNRERASIVIGNNNMITTLRIAPDVSGARSIIGFDAHPVEELWKLSVGDAMTVKKLMTDDERRLWRRYERRLLVIQIGRGAYSYTNDERYDIETNKVLIETLREQYGEHFRTAIAPDAVEHHVKNALNESGVDDAETMHHMNTKSRSDFQGERIGSNIGCIDPGDDYVLDILAELRMNATAERQEATCNACSGDGCNQCNQTGHKRAFGRGFVGDHSESAENLLTNVRENEVAQAVGRYARKADDPYDWAAVFVRTTAIPDQMVDFEGPWVWKYKEKQKAIADYFQNNLSGTAKSIKEWIDTEYDEINSCSKRHVAETCDRHVEAGNIENHERAGYNGAHLYEWTATDSLSEHGELKFEITEFDHSEDQTSTTTPKAGIETLGSD
jgi:hypothetical protein